jgi:hypothetical protein
MAVLRLVFPLSPTFSHCTANSDGGQAEIFNADKDLGSFSATATRCFDPTFFQRVIHSYEGRVSELEAA